MGIILATEQRRFARHLRVNRTKPEDRLWQALRGRKLEGLKFRRQVPLLDYTVDFLCIERHLVVELDGVHHDDQRDYDAKRAAAIEAMGFIVLRFPNEQVMGELDPVLRETAAAAGKLD
ncbi:endonuclease domain-containing protein [Labrys sp. La1]|uniref:endonuclease domain-containing protein n=1 Tax=Labrys sp. La1 TaxID=3404917 RepID=UPI003EC0ECFC